MNGALITTEYMTFQVFTVLVYCITRQLFIETIFAWSWYTSCFAQIITDTWFDGISYLLSFFFFHGECDDAC